jgi:hypothetical protein
MALDLYFPDVPANISHRLRFRSRHLIPAAPSAHYQRPALVLRDRRTFLYAHLVPQLRRIGFVMGMVLLAPPYRLFVERMRETTLNPHDNGFVIRVADHDTL